MVELCEDAEGLGMGEEAHVRVFVHGLDEVFDPHSGSHVPHLWESQAQIFWRPLSSLSGEVG